MAVLEVVVQGSGGGVWKSSSVSIYLGAKLIERNEKARSIPPTIWHGPRNFLVT
jgi:hypothetical protein